MTEQLTRENRDGRVQTYEYTASGERLGRLKVTGTATPEWWSYDVDAQGSVVGLESASTGTSEPDGTDELNTYDTDPYGAPVVDEQDLSDEADANPFRFQGFYRDQETGTYDMQARTYRPELGQFLQQDRFADPQADLTLASDPLTASRYAFTAGNPGTRAEYDGHCTNSAGKSIPGSPYSLAPGTAGPEIPCRLVKNYTPGPLATGQLGPSPISFGDAKATGFVLRQPVAPPPASAEQGKSLIGRIGSAIAKPASAGLAWTACKLQDGMNAMVDVGTMSPGGGKSSCYKASEPALNEALKPDFTSPEAVAATVLGIVQPESRLERLRKVVAEGAEARKATKVGRGGAGPVRTGQAGEASVRGRYDIGEKIPIRVNGRGRIPDGLTPETLSEVKNVSSLSYSRQLRDFTEYARQTGRSFDLYVRPTTRLSRPLQDAVRLDGSINLRFIP